MNTDNFYIAGKEINDKPYHYDVCGLEGIYLLNGYSVEHIDDEEFVSVTNVEGLHKEIGRHLVTNRKALTPREIRFLRKTMDMTQSDLATLLSTTSQSVARWEKGTCEMPGVSEKLLRIFFLTSLLGNAELEELKEFVTSTMTELDTTDESQSAPAAFILNESWSEQQEFEAA